MRILLIAPSSATGGTRKRLFNGKTFRFSMLPLLSVAALTPAPTTSDWSTGDRGRPWDSLSISSASPS
jgi:hypothetical protein